MDPKKPTRESGLLSAPLLARQTRSDSDRSYCSLNLGLTILFVCLFVFVIWMCVMDALAPSPIEFRVESVSSITPLTLAAANSTETATLSGGFNITFWVGQPKYAPLYGRANVSVYYCDYDYDKKTAVEYYLSSSSLYSLCPDRPNCAAGQVQSWVSVILLASSVPVSDDVAILVEKHVTNLREFGITVKISGDWLSTSRDRGKLRVKCEDVRIGVASGAMINEPTKCKVMWSKS